MKFKDRVEKDQSINSMGLKTTDILGYQLLLFKAI